MNKKRLSVVMAGAMLASSVAPVLAAEVTSNETTHGKLGLFVNDLEALMETKKFDVTDTEAGKSVYRFAVLGSDGKDFTVPGATSNNTKTLNLEGGKTVKVYSDATLLKGLANNKTELTIRIYELGHVVTDKGIFSKDTKEASYTTDTFKELTDAVEAYNKDKKVDDIKGDLAGLRVAITEGWITGLDLSSDKKTVTVELGSFKDGNAAPYNTITLTVDSKKVLFKNPVDANGRVLADIFKDTQDSGKIKAKYADGSSKEYTQKNIVGFKIAPASTTTEDITSKKAKLLHEVKLLTGDKSYTVKADDLYDGIMLTKAGHDLMNAIRLFDNDKNNTTYADVDYNITAGKGTERYFKITMTDANGIKHTVKIFGNSLQEKKLEELKEWYAARRADVEEIVGKNRFETAVEIAKTYLSYKGDQYSGNKHANLVLINGDALVDGLAAAPYAKETNAPILLTDKDSLPKETKDFMRELINGKFIGDLNNHNITVTIIGGEAVVSDSVVDELKSYGIRVKRISGEDREETSLAVAHKLANKTNKAFVVGANGEADAMSIASYASATKAPIIVAASEKTGLSTDGLNEVADYENIEIIGGEGVVSKDTEDTLKELVSDKATVSRINGKDRWETNALVIKKHHHNFVDVLVSKDGMANKSHLVDALPASLFASSTKGVTTKGTVTSAAPIVLATETVSKDQLNEIVLHAYKDGQQNGYGTVYQIGGGVAPSVMKTIATKLGLDR